VALSAFVAGAMFMAAPSGRLMGMTEVTLARSPFRSYLVPGIVLFAVVGGTQALAAWAEIQRWKSAGWLSVVAGVVLAGWIAVQVAMIGLGHPMQPSLFVAGGVDAGLGRWRRTKPWGVGDRANWIQASTQMPGLGTLRSRTMSRNRTCLPPRIQCPILLS
jgi:hypothetical protein